MAIVWKTNRSGEKTAKVRIVKKSPEIKGLTVEKTASGIKTLEEAQKIERKLNKEAERELFRREQEGMKWKNLVARWEIAARSGDIFARKIQSSTVNEYARVLHNHTKDWMNLRITQIDKAMAWRLLDKIDREVSISKRKKVRSAIDSVYSWGCLSGEIRERISLPTEGYKTTRKEEEKIPEILSISEIRALLKAAEDIEFPWTPIWSMALLTGLRSGELFALTWRQVDFDAGLLYIHENWTNKEGMGATKGRYWRTVPIGPELKRTLLELRARSKGGYKDEVWKWNKSRTDRIFYIEPNFVLPRFQSWKDGRQAGILRTFCEGIGIQPIRFHTLRACFATQLIKDAVAPAVVMKICGWKDLKTMQRYIRLAGIETKGATDGLKILPPEKAVGRVYELFKK